METNLSSAFTASVIPKYKLEFSIYSISHSKVQTVQHLQCLSFQSTNLSSAFTVSVIPKYKQFSIYSICHSKVQTVQHLQYLSFQSKNCAVRDKTKDIHLIRKHNTVPPEKTGMCCHCLQVLVSLPPTCCLPRQ